MKRIFLALWFGTLTIAASAATTTTSVPSANYDIEVLVFEIRTPEFEGSELWTHAAQPPDASAAVPPQDLPLSANFSAAAAALRGDSRFRLLLQKHWIQNADTRSNVPAVHLTSGNGELDGTLKFYLSRFLHLEVNLAFEPQATAIGADAAPSYVINEQRRIKSNELNYFDHPKFGVIVKVVPVPA